jgi:hypothetical protein
MKKEWLAWAYLLTDCRICSVTASSSTDCSITVTVNYHSRTHQPRLNLVRFGQLSRDVRRKAETLKTER